jgi:hypothetical protein
VRPRYYLQNVGEGVELVLSLKDARQHRVSACTEVGWARGYVVLPEEGCGAHHSDGRATPPAGAGGVGGCVWGVSSCVGVCTDSVGSRRTAAIGVEGIGVGIQKHAASLRASP